jgi:hypothetical protein
MKYIILHNMIHKKLPNNQCNKKYKIVCYRNYVYNIGVILIE